MKHFTLNWALVLIVAISLGLTGCGDDDNNGSSGNGETNGEGVLLLENAGNLRECTNDEKEVLDTGAGTWDLRGNSPVDAVEDGNCYDVEPSTGQTEVAHEARFNAFVSVAKAEEFTFCGWFNNKTYKDEDIVSVAHRAQVVCKVAK